MFFSFIECDLTSTIGPHSVLMFSLRQRLGTGVFLDCSTKSEKQNVTQDFEADNNFFY